MRAIQLGVVILAGRRDERALPLLQALSDSDPDVRSGAEAELRRLAASVEPTLRAWTGHPDPEVAGRCRDLLQDLDQARRSPVGRITSLNAAGRYLYLDSVPGVRLLRGERFEVLRGRSWVATIESEIAAGPRPSRARLTLVDGDLEGLHEHELTVVPGGPEVRSAARSAPVEAEITLIDDERNHVEINLRRRDGVRVGEICEIVRAGSRVGRVSIARVDECASIVLPFDSTGMEDLREGDRVQRSTPRPAD